MKQVIFATGNKGKATYATKLLGFEVVHQALDLPEIQSLDLRDIIGLKLQRAFEIIQKPVLVEDVSLEFEALGKLPGPFVKFFIDQIGLESMCRMLDGKSRKCTARCIIGYKDADTVKFFEGVRYGEVAQKPTGDGGFGYDKIFIPDGYKTTRANMNKRDDEATYLQLKRWDLVRDFLNSHKIP